MHLGEIKERKIAGAKILLKLIESENCPLTKDELKVLVDCLRDLEELNELMNYMGEKAINHQNNERLNRN